MRLLSTLQFEPTVSLGAILTIVSFVVTVLVAYTRFVARITKLETKLNIMWSAFRQRWSLGKDDEDAFNGH